MYDHQPESKEESRTTQNMVTEKTQATGSMIRLSIWVSFAAWITNFDNGYSGTVLIMPSYKKAFGTCHDIPNPATGGIDQQCSITALQQSLISLNFLFIALGGGVSGLAGRYVGRRGSIQIGCILAIIGAGGMIGTVGSFLHYMICRCISAVGIGQLMTASVTYGSECIVAHQRGLSLGLYNVGLALGNVASSAVCAGSSRLEPDNHWQWKTPILCQIPLGVLLGAGILMFPESPRWLMNHNREEEARHSFGVLYQQEPYSAKITAQIEDVKSHIQTECAGATSSSWVDIYRRKNVRRTLISAMIMVGLAITGIQFAQPYAALFLQGVGISNPYLINVIIGLCILAGACLGPFIVEYGGRRRAILVGYSIMAICMLVLSSVSTVLGMDASARMVIVVFLCLWAFVFGGTIAPSASLASVEMHSVSLRTYGQANSTIFFGVFSFGAIFWTPYMLNPEYGDMGANVGYFYAGVTIVMMILVFLFVPETARLTLEQIDDLFTSEVSAWQTSTAKNRSISVSKGGEVEEKVVF